jgi:hypothetical protein
MPLEVGSRYKAVVTSAEATEKEDGTFGIAVSFHTDEGDIEHTLWIELGEFLQYRRKDLKTLGATDENLVDWEWLQAPGSLVGAKCSIVIGDYFGRDGKAHLKVKYINSIRRESKKSSAQSAALMLCGTPEPEPQSFGARSANGASESPPLWQGERAIEDEPPPF